MTKENAHEFLPLVQALVDGKDLQLSDENGNWMPLYNPVYFDRPSTLYRIKPEPVMVPLGPEDVNPGDFIRKISNPNYRYLICSVTDSVGTDGDDIEWRRLSAEYEIKRPGEDWMPCCKPASK